MDYLEKFRTYLNEALAALAGVFLLGMVLLACSNMVLRTFGKPILGTFELMGFMGAVVAAFSLGYSQLSKGHISVSLLTGKLPWLLEKTLDIIGSAAGAIFFFIIAWELIKLAEFLEMVGELSETLRLAYYPFVYAVSFGCCIMGLTLFTDIILLFAAKKRLKVEVPQ